MHWHHSPALAWEHRHWSRPGLASARRAGPLARDQPPTRDRSSDRRERKGARAAVPASDLAAALARLPPPPQARPTPGLLPAPEKDPSADRTRVSGANRRRAARKRPRARAGTARPPPLA